MTDESELDDIEGYDALAELLADPSLWVEPPASLEERVMNAVAAEPHGAGVGSTGAASAAGRARSKRPRSLSRWAVPFVIGAAAASVAAVVIVAGGSDDEPTADASVTLDVGPAAPAGVEAGQVALRVTPSGLRLDLAARSLPSLTDGSAYQCWVRTAAGLQTCGTFHTGGDGIVLWSAVRDLKAVEAVSITLEPPADPDPASSGQRVLSGPVAAGG